MPKLKEEKKIETGDGREAADESQFEGPDITAQIDMMQGAAPEDSEEPIKNLDMGDDVTPKSVPVKDREHGETEVEEEPELEASSVTEEVKPELIADGAPEPEVIDEKEETSAKEVIELRAQILAMQELLKDPAAQVSTQLEEPATPVVEVAPVAPTPQAPVGVITPPTEEEFADMLADPAKFTNFFTQAMAIHQQQIMLNINPMVAHQITLGDTIKDFFNREENSDVAKGSIRQLVVQYAGQIEGQGQATGSIADTLSKAVEMVRTRLKIQEAKGPVAVGRKNLEAARVPDPRKPQRFAGGNQTRTPGKGAEEETDETLDMLDAMANAGGRRS